MDKSSVDEKVDTQEEKYLIITNNYLNSISKTNGKNLIVKRTPPKSGVDICVTAFTTNLTGIETYSIEVKERNKNFNINPCCELKVAKYESMRNAFDYFRNRKLIYIVYGEEDVFVFNLTDGCDYPHHLWNIKDTQFDDESEKEPQDTYFIPTSEAVYHTKINRNALYS